jgi:ABC-type lipoprotein release transport system permease subunit
MKLGRMAWRNLWRRRRRTWITAITIAFGLMFSVTFIAISDYSHTNMITTSATMGFGNLTLEPTGYNETPTPDKRLRDAEAARELIQGLPGVTSAIVRITGQAMFASAAQSVGGTFIGIDPAQESPGRNIFLRSMAEGSVFEGPGGPGAVVGAKMAEHLNLRIGKKLVFTSTDIHDEIVSEIVRVTGIFRTGVSEVDGYVVLLPIDTVRATLHYGPREASIVSIFINDYRKADGMRATIASAVGNPDRSVLTWNETQPDMAGLVNLDRRMHFLLQFLVALLIAAGILNTILMGVMERTREFGIMMAVGLSPGALFRLVLVESFWIGLIGILAGIVITTPWFLYMSRTGIDIRGLIQGGYSAGGVVIEPIIKFRLYPESVVAILLEIFLLSLIAGLYPAFKAGRIPPVESLKRI